MEKKLIFFVYNLYKINKKAKKDFAEMIYSFTFHKISYNETELTSTQLIIIEFVFDPIR